MWSQPCKGGKHIMSWQLGDRILDSRLLMGTAQYPSLQVMADAITVSQTQFITAAIRRQQPESGGGDTFWACLRELNCHILPNTAGCHTAKQAITAAQLCREIFNTHWIKLEVIGDEYNLQPDPFELITAADALVKQGFEVLPYCTDDLIVCQRLIDCGCRILMPWAAPIGSGLGLTDRHALLTLRHRLPKTTLIVDAGIGTPSEAAEVMEMGFDGVLVNSAIAHAQDPVKMAQAFSLAVQSGRLAYEAVRMPKRSLTRPSTPLLDTPFWQQVDSCDDKN